MVMITERPLLFQGEMVRATLDGRKTQTRRTRGLDKVNADQSSVFVRMQVMKCGSLAAVFENGNGELGAVKSPYGKPGDHLWVREALVWDEHHAHPGWVYKADGAVVRGGNALTYPRRSVPSIHLKRWASRITLEVESVRVERLQEISGHDSLAEGIPAWCVRFEDGREELDQENMVDEYRKLWESINGPGIWASNPWVWVVTFNRIKP